MGVVMLNGYIIVGKRITASTFNEIRDKLRGYNLTLNNKSGVRRISDPEETHRYVLLESGTQSRRNYDICIGVQIFDGQGRERMINIPREQLAKVFDDVTTDIPNAELIIGHDRG
jgi:hypothetical protein